MQSAPDPLRSRVRSAKFALKRLFHAASWSEVSSTEYQAGFHEFGGSIDLHPAVIRLLEKTTSHRARYFGLTGKGRLLAAIPVWTGRVKATRKLELASQLSPDIDLGQGELILPVRPDERIFLPFRANGISELHAGSILNAAPRADVAFMLAKGHATGPDRLNGKVLYNQRTQHKRFCEAGGTYQDVRELAVGQVAEIYRGLFRTRWGREPQGAATLEGTFEELRDLMGGGVLWYEGKPIAVEILYKYPTPVGMLAVGVNGGVDPQFKAFSPGSILHYLHGMKLEQEATSLSLPMRFSFGHNDAPYKTLWCRECAALET